MTAKLCKWGNSLGIRVPAHVAAAAGLAAGDYLYVRLLDCGDILVRATKPGNVPAGYAVVPSGGQPAAPSRAEVEEKW